MLKKWCAFLNCNIDGLNRVEFESMFLDVLRCLFAGQVDDVFLNDLVFDLPDDRKALAALQEMAQGEIVLQGKKKDKPPALVGHFQQSFQVWIVDGQHVRKPAACIRPRMAPGDPQVKAGKKIARIAQKNYYKVEKKRAREAFGRSTFDPVKPQQPQELPDAPGLLHFSRFLIPAESALLAAYTSNIQLNRILKCSECSRYEKTNKGKKEALCTSCLNKARVRRFRKTNRRLIGEQADLKRRGVKKSISVLRADKAKKPAKKVL